MAVASLFAATLTVLDGATPRPGLAENYEMSEDGLTYTFDLREGLTFSDGTDLTANAVVATMDRLRQDEANVNAADYTSWDSIEAVDDTTVVFHLTTPQPALPILLAAPWNGIYPVDAADDPDFFRHPISAGAYVLTDYSSSGDRLVLEANDRYYGSPPGIETVVFTTVPDENTRILQLKNDELDIAYELDPASIAQFESHAATSGEVLRLAGMYYMWMSNRDGPLSDVDVRRATSLAIDRDQINQIVWQGMNEPSGSLLPPGVEGFEDNIQTDRDVQAAKDLLAGTECANGCTINVQIREGRPIDRNTALVIQENLAEVGITVTIDPIENSVSNERLNNGDFDVEIGWLGLPVPDTSTYLRYAVMSDGGIEALFSGYQSAEMDAAAHALVTEPDPAARAELLKTINQIFAADLPYVPLQPWALVVGVRDEVRDLFEFDYSGYVRVVEAA